MQKLAIKSIFTLIKLRNKHKSDSDPYWDYRYRCAKMVRWYNNRYAKEN